MFTSRRLLTTHLIGWVLLAPDDGTGNGGPAPVADPDPQVDDPTAEPAGKSFSQADVDAIVAKRVKAEQAKFAGDLKTLKDRGDLDEVERLKAEVADRDKALADADQRVLSSDLRSTAERAALAAGANPARVAKFMRTFDLDIDTLTADGKVDAEAVTALVESELNDSPEFKAEGAPAAPNAGKPSGGDFTGANPTAKVWTRAEIAKLSPAEFEEHEAEISRQVAAGTVK